MNALPRPANCRTSRICLPADPTAAGLAREFVREALPQWGLDDLRDDAELVVSELVTNAVRVTETAAASPVRDERQAGQVTGVQLRYASSSLYIEVWDRDDSRPAIPDQAPDAENGRGLFLVSFLSTCWSSRTSPAGGKVTWAELQRPSPAPAAACAELPPCNTSNCSQVADEEAIQLMNAAFALNVLEELGQPDQTPVPNKAVSQAPRRRTWPRRLSQEPAAVTQARKDAGMTRGSLAQAVGISEQLLGEPESGRRSATPSNLKKIAAVLRRPATALRRRPAGRSHRS